MPCGAGAALCRGNTWSVGFSKSASCKPCPAGYVIAAARDSNPAERDSAKKCSEWQLTAEQHVQLQQSR